MRSSKGAPLKLLALAVAGILLGIGLCNAHSSRYDGYGIWSLILSAVLGAVALIWLVISLIFDR